MRILICGGRNFNDHNLFGKIVDPYTPVAELIIHGGAAGADEMAQCWADWCDIPVQYHVANWSEYGKAAGPIRNQAMIDEGKPDLVIAFPGGKGTADMVRRAKKAGIPVEEISGRPATSMKGRPSSIGLSLEKHEHGKS